jgi:hypothetical protein
LGIDGHGRLSGHGKQQCSYSSECGRMGLHNWFCVGGVS